MSVEIFLSSAQLYVKRLEIVNDFGVTRGYWKWCFLLVVCTNNDSNVHRFRDYGHLQYLCDGRWPSEVLQFDTFEIVDHVHFLIRV